MFSDEEDTDECILILWQWLLLNSKKSRKFWVHPYNTRRNNTIVDFLQELRKYEDKFFNYTRMSLASCKMFESNKGQGTVPDVLRCVLFG